MNRTARWVTQLVASATAQALLATATASAAPAPRPCVPVPARQEAPAPAADHHAGPVRRGDSCATVGQTAYTEQDMHLVTCSRWRGLNHLTWGP